jgi:UDP-glucose 4-epimerase
MHILNCQTLQFLIATNTGRKDVMESTDRRPGAPARLVASLEKIYYKELGWKAEYSLEDYYLKSMEAASWKREGKYKASC